MDERKVQVLVVEDDPGILRLQQKRLERDGYEVKVATSAAEALEQVRAHTIDLLLLDQNLPGGVNGLDFYQQIKQAGYDMPAILVTGFTGESIVLQSFRAGVFDFIPKTPDYLEYLMPTIDRVVKKRLTESKLVESETRLASIIRTALDAFLTVDEQHRIGLFNPAAESCFGLTSAEAVGQPIERFFPSWADGLPQGEVKPGQRLVRGETIGVRADGSHFFAELSISRVEAVGRHFWTLVARDISERKKAQEERERLIREQAARKEAEAAHDRMAAVARENDRLYQELRQVDRHKDEFLAMLAHELRNPLAPIRNSLHLIRLSPNPLPPELQENWAIIDRQVNYLVRLVDDLLDVSRISQGKIQLQMENLDLATVVDRALESSRPLIHAREHTINVSVAKEPLAIEADPVRLVQVLANLLNNAAKYTPEKGRIDLSVEREGDQAVVKVRDTGVGISPEILPRLFDLFTQSKRSLDRSEGGLGIGLTLVRHITEMHGGTVEASSAGPGLGSSFTLRLPIASNSSPRAPKAVLPALTKALRAVRVLVVDDNQDSVATLSRLLHVMGNQAMTAHDGARALELAAKFRPDVILLDIGLPGMDGYEVARRIRSLPGLESTVLVALTGYGSTEDRQHSENAGFHAHLVKPVDLDELGEILANPRALLDRAQEE